MQPADLGLALCPPRPLFGPTSQPLANAMFQKKPRGEGQEKKGDENKSVILRPGTPCTMKSWEQMNQEMWESRQGTPRCLPFDETP